MASSICHTRSNSLPSRSHPFVSEINEHFCRLKANSEATSSSSICQKLNGLQDLYDCVDKLLLLPTLVQEKNDKCVNELLDGSLRIFDLCSTAKDVLLQIKEFTQELQSILRRRGDMKLTSEIKKYLTSRKAVRKAIKKALANSKAKKLDNDNESQAMAGGIMKEVEAISLTVFKSLLSFISGPKAQSKLSGWSSVYKLTHHKRVASVEGETDQANEFAKVDAALLSLIDHKICIGDVQKQLKNLELCIQDFDEGLDCLSRRLIKTRISLLNALNN
ncbi:hypothetical protein EZV62_003947 [Acer yangbiense]|uniref:Uncharacterized protein n=1 Tax=Acer yangbiense TaxID=1000413 RepID=A0A5C7IK47_9ROSI|nr:hypothetical protein EZV62_003947 [Acer yangbiense]